MSSKYIFIKWFLAVMLVFGMLFAEPVVGAESWTSFTDMNSAVEFRYNNGLLWGAAPGGAFAIDSNEVVILKLTNIEGMKGLQLNAIEIDSSGNIWFGAKNGTLSKFDSDGDYLTYYLIFEHPNVVDEPMVIYDLFADGEWLWIARQQALSQFSINNNGGEIKENIYYLGPFSSPDVKVCYVESNKIWFGCESGIGYADKNSQLLPDPAVWTVYHSGNPAGLGNFDIKSIIYFDSLIYAGTAAGVYKLNELPSDTSWTLSGLTDRIINNLREISDTLFAVTDNGLYYFNGSGWSSYNPAGYPGGGINDVVLMPASGIWTALSNGGFAKFNGTWEKLYLPGPRGSSFGEIDATLNSVVAVARGPRGHAGTAVNYFDRNTWENYTAGNSGMYSNTFWSSAIDSSGKVWIGYWGAGVDVFDLSDSSWFHYNNNNSPLRGVLNSPNYIAVSCIEVDNHNNVWISSYSAESPYAVFILRNDSTWQEIQKSSEGLQSNWIVSIETAGNRAFIGTRHGLDVLDFGSDLGDTTDFSWGHIDDHSGLADNVVNDVDIDNEGTVWIATPAGLNKYNVDDINRIDSVALPFEFGPTVRAVEIDGVGNKWFGTPNGLLKLSPDNITWTTYTTENSGLVNSDILSLSMVNATGILWIGTRGGISRLDTGMEQPSEDLSGIGTYPNPAGPKFSSQIYFSRVPFGAYVYIYNTAGEKIIEFPAGNDGGLTSWDYSNDSGEICAGGVYIYHVRSSNNEYSSTGKFVLIR